MWGWPISRQPYVNTTFCTPYNLDPHSPMMLKLLAQDQFRAQSDITLTLGVLKWKI